MSSPPSIVVLGTDALAAALPSTAVQLAHACRRAGYDIAVPASWGDELVAKACLREVTLRAGDATIMASCPLVRTRILAAGSELASMLLPIVAPPVAIARYLRRIQGSEGIRITYVGACPDAADAAIDEQVLPDEFIGRLGALGIEVAAQPRVFDSIIPPDRRRHFSQPGGLPSPELLWSHGRGRSLVQVDADDLAAEVAQLLLASEPLLIDLAPRLGCHCSGAAAGVPARSSRAAVAALEPPRSPAPVLEELEGLDLTPA